MSTRHDTSLLLGPKRQLCDWMPSSEPNVLVLVPDPGCGAAAAFDCQIRYCLPLFKTLLWWPGTPRLATSAKGSANVKLDSDQLCFLRFFLRPDSRPSCVADPDSDTATVNGGVAPNQSSRY